VTDDAELPRFSLARRDYLRHPVLLAEILALHGLMRLTSGPARRALGRAIGELKVAVCDRRARARLAAAAGRAPHRLNIGCGEKPRAGWLNIAWVLLRRIAQLAEVIKSSGFSIVHRMPSAERL